MKYIGIEVACKEGSLEANLMKKKKVESDWSKETAKVSKKEFGFAGYK